MEDWEKTSVDLFESYINTFSGLTEEQRKNFAIKKEHSRRVAGNSKKLADLLNLEPEDTKLAVIIAIFHDMGRFKQLVTYDSFNDAVSEDHAEVAVEILKEKGFIADLKPEEQEIVFSAIRLHNKFELLKKLNERELLHARILRDADKLDILKVLSDYYTDKNQMPNHTLTWDLPKATQVSSGVVKEVLGGKLVSKNEVKSEMDVKIMQLSWVFDINFKSSIEIIFQNRYLEKIYSSLPKNDTVIEIYRKIKVFAENKLFE
ncbi:MAG: HD domain-containing protein [Mariniphaga sp.]|nr:HD domain-containing protein [Mariniphaga sp.]